MSFWKKPSSGPAMQVPLLRQEPEVPAPIRQRDCSEDAKPHFRFYPNAYEDGHFEESDVICWLCGCSCGWQYVGAIYDANKPKVVCARCLADGTLATSTDDADPESDDVDKDLWFEAECRTPGISTFNPFVWPIINREPLVYLGHADQRDLAKLAEVREAMAALAKEFEWPEVGPHHAMIFRTLDGAKWRAALDLS